MIKRLNVLRPIRRQSAFIAALLSSRGDLGSASILKSQLANKLFKASLEALHVIIIRCITLLNASNIFIYILLRR